MTDSALGCGRFSAEQLDTAFGTNVLAPVKAAMAAKGLNADYVERDLLLGACSSLSTAFYDV